MEFKLILVPETPDKLLLKPETPLAGLTFIEHASACLRRSLDTTQRMRHSTLGAVAQYELLVPQAIAIESCRFGNTNTIYVPCEENFLKKFIFYGATLGRSSTRRNVYPYYTDEIVLTSYIDELAIIEIWRNRDYPDKLTINLGGYDDIPLVPDTDVVDGPNIGDLVLDDIMVGLR